MKVTEYLGYGGFGGRVSDRDTTITFDGDNAEAQTFTQWWSYTALGDVDKIGYPRCTFAECQADGADTVRTVNYDYELGYLRSVNGYASTTATDGGGLLKERSYTYDSFGNIQGITGNPGRTTPTNSFLRHTDRKIHLAIPEMMAEIDELAAEKTSNEDCVVPPVSPQGDFPFILMAGERRSYNANTIIRDQSWRKRAGEGALRVHTEDARSLGLVAGGRALCESPRGAVEARVEITDELLPGVASMPHGYGMEEPENGEPKERDAWHRIGPAVNDLTASDHCDELAKTPFHKYIPVRIRPLVTSGTTRNPIRSS